MKTYEIINLAPGTDSRSAVNKDQLDIAIQEIFIPGGKRYLEYQNIISNFKPSLWLSSYYNNGLIIKSSYNQLDTTAVENLVNKTMTINEDVSKTINNGFYGFRLNGDNRIVSSSTFMTKFTFFFVMSADATSSGKLITSDTGNVVFGYWGTRLGTLWINENINLQGFSSNDGNIQFLICRNENDVKTAWRYDKSEKKLKSMLPIQLLEQIVAENGNR